MTYIAKSSMYEKEEFEFIFISLGEKNRELEDKTCTHFLPGYPKYVI